MFWALEDVSFEVQSGEVFGIIGPNGAGKTTILKLLSKVTRPTRGNIVVNGRVAALIELGAGFHPDLTGRENIYLNGAILGLSKAEIERKLDSIVGFAELDRFIDTPVKRYSSGMYVRLGFAVAAHVDPEILLTDEILAVGDMAYQEKCLSRIREFAREGRTVVIVSHDLNSVASLCQRALLLDEGRVTIQGPTAEVIAEYHMLASRRSRRVAQRELILEGGTEGQYVTLGAEITNVELIGVQGVPMFSVHSGELTILKVRVRFREAAENPIFGFILYGPDGRPVYGINTLWRDVKSGCFKAGQEVTVEYRQPMALSQGTHTISTGIAYPDLKTFYDWRENAVTFFVTADEQIYGVANLGTRIFIDGEERVSGVHR